MVLLQLLLLLLLLLDQVNWLAGTLSQQRIVCGYDRVWISDLVQVVKLLVLVLVLLRMLVKEQGGRV